MRRWMKRNKKSKIVYKKSEIICKKVCIKKKLTDYRAVIFDLDGTLYSQPRLRLLMAFALLRHYLLHPRKIKELLILREYRIVREHWKDGGISEKIGSENSEIPRRAAAENMEEAQYARTGEKMGVAPETVKQIVARWMHEYPLLLLPGCRDDRLAELIGFLRKRNVITAVYSDYPVKDKLTALGIEVDSAFSAADPAIGCMKPDPRGMRAVLSSLDVSGGEALMIGDRYAKDGVSAKNADMDYVILAKSMPCRSFILRRLKEQCGS